MTTTLDGLNPPYRVIVADPPWNFATYSARGRARNADRHYPVMSLPDIKALNVGALAAPDCHLFLWSTSAHCAQSLDVLTAWGFKLSGLAFVWLKLKPTAGPPYSWGPDSFAVGMGLTTRKNAEYVFLGRRGSPKRKARNIRDLIFSRRREHSRKPDAFYDQVEAYSDGPYLDLFARQSRPGWDSWGNESTKFDGA